MTKQVAWGPVTMLYLQRRPAGSKPGALTILLDGLLCRLPELFQSKGSPRM